VKYDDISELAETMGKMLNNEDLLREIGRKGRKFVFENCNWENIVTEFEKVYEEASSRSDPRIPTRELESGFII
jgi:glycosyltransferase involved in cell wall biosynthesis